VVLLVAIVGFYVFLYFQGIDATTARAEGWLLGPFPDGGPLRTMAPRIVTGADWHMVLMKGGQISAIVLVSVLALLLNASGLELAARRDIDLNRELLAAGVANLMSGFAGGMVGYHSLSMSSLNHEMGARTRLGGVAAGLVALVGLLAGSSLLAYIPRLVIGGMLLYMGLDFLYTWVVKSWHKLSRAEYEVVILILLAVGAFGFLPGVGLGLIVTVVLFVVTFSHVRVVKHEFTLAVRQSNVDRSRHERAVLHEHGNMTQMLCLQSHIFFGTASQVLGAVRKRLADKSMPDLQYVIVDFRLVTGLDSSAVFSFDRMRQLAETHDFFIVFSSLPDSMLRLIAKARLLDLKGDQALGEGKNDARVLAAPDLDAAIEWVENAVLMHETSDNEEDDGEALWEELVEIFGPAGRGFLKRRQFDAGEYLVRQGEEATDMLFILAGQVTILQELTNGKIVRIRTMRPGTVVGEVGWYRGLTRSASVVADTPTTVCRLSGRALQSMEKIGPRRVSAFHKFMAGLLANRLAEMFDWRKSQLD
jgi:SulP family sulfate permease